MRQHRRTTRLVAIFAGLALVAAACGDDDDDEVVEEEPEEEVDDEEVAPAEDRLVIGRVAPETGPLAFLGPPQIEGVALAVEDINEAGGVLGQDVELLEGDEGETPETARESVVRLLGEGANAIVGAAASGSSQEFIQLLFDNQIPQCSPSNTSPAFSDQENAAFYFRTVPGDEAVTPVITDRVLGDGHSDIAVVARADDYGEALRSLVDEGLDAAGANVAASISYDPEAATFDAEVDEIVGANPDAVVIIAFDEGGQIIAGLLERGVTADQLYGADGVFSPTLYELVDPGDPNVTDGMTVIGAAGDEEFNDRIAEPTENNFIYGGQAYDCGIVMALAVEAGQSLDGQDIVDNALAVTSDGTECTSFAECKDLLEAGEDIDYNGAAGPLDLSDVGDPTQATYAIGEYQDGVLTIIDSRQVEA